MDFLEIFLKWKFINNIWNISQGEFFRCEKKNTKTKKEERMTKIIPSRSFFFTLKFHNPIKNKMFWFLFKRFLKRFRIKHKLHFTNIPPPPNSTIFYIYMHKSYPNLFFSQKSHTFIFIQ